MPRRFRGGAGPQPGIGLMLLFMQLAQVGFGAIPPITLIAIIGQVAVYLEVPHVKWPSLTEVCISPATVWYNEQYTRLALAAFFHIDEWHLYFNMVSFLWKGISLEKRFGSGYFLYMLIVFTLLSNVTTIGLSMLAEKVFHSPKFLNDCAIGFSGVIFGLKVVTTHLLPPGVTYILGIFPMYSRMVCWAELLLIQLLVPNASFVGHLAGILVGTLYCYGPLKSVMDIFVEDSPSYTYTSEPSGRAYDHYDTDRSRAQPYTGGLSEEEQMQQAIDDSLHEATNRRRRQAPSVPRPHNNHHYQYQQPAPPWQTQQDNRPGYSGPNQSTSQGSGLYPDLSGVANGDTSSRSGGNSGGDDAISQEGLRRRRVNRFS